MSYLGPCPALPFHSRRQAPLQLAGYPVPCCISAAFDALAAAHLALQGSLAIGDVLFGELSPSGRLPVSFPFNNFTAQSDFYEMSMRRWPGRTHRHLQARRARLALGSLLFRVTDASFVGLRLRCAGAAARHTSILLALGPAHRPKLVQLLFTTAALCRSPSCTNLGMGCLTPPLPTQPCERRCPLLLTWRHHCTCPCQQRLYGN